MHIEGTDDTLLRYLHTDVQQLQQVGWDAFSLIAAMRQKQILVTFTYKTVFNC